MVVGLLFCTLTLLLLLLLLVLVVELQQVHLLLPAGLSHERQSVGEAVALVAQQVVLLRWAYRRSSALGPLGLLKEVLDLGWRWAGRMRIASVVVELVSLRMLLLQGWVAEQAVVEQIAPAIVMGAVRLRGVGRGPHLRLPVLEEPRLRWRLHLRHLPGLGLFLRWVGHLSQEAWVPGYI